jgi:hypothetical protein
MDEFSRRYDNMYPLHPEYTQYDSSESINPGIQKQHLAPFDGRPTGYQSVPRYQLSQDEDMPYPSKMSRAGTFAMEKMVYDINKQVSYIFYIHILTLVLIIIVVICSVISVLATGIANKRS